jgi:hypothetical protein
MRLYEKEGVGGNFEYRTEGGGREEGETNFCQSLTSAPKIFISVGTETEYSGPLVKFWMKDGADRSGGGRGVGGMIGQKEIQCIDIGAYCFGRVFICVEP